MSRVIRLSAQFGKRTIFYAVIFIKTIVTSSDRTRIKELLTDDIGIVFIISL